MRVWVSIKHVRVPSLDGTPNGDTEPKVVGVFATEAAAEAASEAAEAEPDVAWAEEQESEYHA